jgi:hypothetical protein
VLHLDRWLVAPQPTLRRRVTPVVMRLVVAVLIGAVVAEPLVLRIFQTAIVAQVQHQRHSDEDAERNRLLICNPDPSRPHRALPASCTKDDILSFGASSTAQQTRLATLRADTAKLQQRVDQEQKGLDSLDNQVLTECAKQITIAGSGGRWERSSECLRLRKVAAAYRATHDTTGDTTRLNSMNDEIATLAGTVAGSENDFLATRNTKIDQRLAKLRSEQGDIGVLERMRALDQLAGKNIVLFIGVWLVRLLFVVIDVLPVLVKFFSGETTYDRLLTERSNSAVTIYGELLRTDERKAMARFEIERLEAEQRVRERKAEFDAARREHVAAMNIRVSQAVNALEAELTRVGSSV